MRYFTKLASTLIVGAAAFALVGSTFAKDDPKDVWAKDVPYTTDWKTAIDSCKETGRLLFVYNGWKAEGI